MKAIILLVTLTNIRIGRSTPVTKDSGKLSNYERPIDSQSAHSTSGFGTTSPRFHFASLLVLAWLKCDVRHFVFFIHQEHRRIAFG